MMKYYMRKKLPVLLAVTGLLMLAGAAFTQEFPEADPYGGGSEMPTQFISPGELKQMIDEGSDKILVVDNAPELAYEEEHIPGAVNFPWTQAIKPPVTLPRNKTLVFYCPCGPGDADSIDMSKKLRRFGYFNTKVLEGGWFKWLELGYPVESNIKEDS
jgi:rhodanese-related sulfurtransferase